MIAFITCKSSLVPLFEGLCTSNPCRFEFSVFRVSYCILSREKIKLVNLLLLFNVIVNIYVYFCLNIAIDFVTGLLIFVDIYQFNHTYSLAHTEKHTHKHTCTISAQEE